MGHVRLHHVAPRAHGVRPHVHGRSATLPARRSPGGLTVVTETSGGKQVTNAELQQAVAALRVLPAADLALIARAGIVIHLYPVAGLEDGLLGATTIVQDTDGRWNPTVIRVAARAGLPGTQSIGEIVQHEFGHAVAVIRTQNRSEAAAISYARTH